MQRLAVEVLRHTRIGLLLLAGLAAAGGLGAHPIGAQVSPSSEARAARWLDALWSGSESPAISAALASGQRLVFSRGIGYANLDDLTEASGTTVYNIGSISKVIAAVAVMQLVEAGKISLDDPVSRYVAQLPESMAGITIRQVMTHTSGIRHYADDDFPHGLDGENVHPASGFEDAVPVWSDEPLRFEPGAFYLYSSYAVNLLEGVVERASGADFEDYLRERIWAPAGMLSTQFDRPERVVRRRARSYDIVDGRPRNHPYGDLTYKFAGGGMLSSVEDLVRFGVAVAHSRLLGSAANREMLRPHLDRVFTWRADEPPREENFKMALLWRLRLDDAGRTFIYHCGSVLAFNSCLVIYPDDDLVAAVAYNGSGLGFRPALDLAEIFRPAGATQDPKEVGSR